MNARVVATVALVTVVGAAVAVVSLLGAGDRPAPRAAATSTFAPVAPATRCDGGALTFDSEPGCGTTFHVRLPIAGLQPAAEPARAA